MQPNKRDLVQVAAFTIVVLFSTDPFVHSS